MSEPLTIAGAHQRIDGHEELCAERYARIFDTLEDLKIDAKNHSKLLMGVLLSIAGFLAVTILAVMLHALKLA